MEAFHENISQAAEAYEAMASSGKDFNSQFRIDPETGAATKIGLWSRIRGTGQMDVSARIKVVEKILQEVISKETEPRDMSANTAMLQESAKQMREVEFARAMFKGVTWDPKQAEGLRNLDSTLDAQVYHLRVKMQALLQSSAPYVNGGGCSNVG